MGGEPADLVQVGIAADFWSPRVVPAVCRTWSVPTEILKLPRFPDRYEDGLTHAETWYLNTTRLALAPTVQTTMATFL